MNPHHGIRYIPNEPVSEFTSEAFYARRAQETYISANRDLRSSGSKDQQPFTTSPARFEKNGLPKKQDSLPPTSIHFQRNRNNSAEKNVRYQTECISAEKGSEENRREVLKFSQLRKKLEEEMRERKRLQEMNACQQLKLDNLREEINKLHAEKKELERTILGLQKITEDCMNNLAKAQQNIQQLNRNLKDTHINQKSLGNLKNIQNQLEYFQQRNLKLTAENQELSKANQHLKTDIQRQTRDCTLESECSIRVPQNYDHQLGEKNVVKSQRQFFLESSLHELEKRLYAKQSEMKKLQIQLNCIDRKKVFSIDQVNIKKDQELKDLRLRFMKVTKDLKDTKAKFQKNEKKSLKDAALLRKVKSSKHLGMASQSEEMTFELSAESKK